jgi:putative hydrolase of the HAD superfamily
MRKLPKAILFDLDDTILAAFGHSEGQWRRVVAAFIEDLAPHPPDDVVAAIQAYSRHLWSDAARHKDWRPRIGAARRHIVSRAFAGLAGAAGRTVPPSAVCDAMADRFNEIPDAELRMFPGAHETLDRVKPLGVR